MLRIVITAPPPSLPDMRPADALVFYLGLLDGLFDGRIVKKLWIKFHEIFERGRP